MQLSTNTPQSPSAAVTNTNTFCCGFIVIQLSTATSQQMDDLFDILIESGGMFSWLKGMGHHLFAKNALTVSVVCV